MGIELVSFVRADASLGPRRSTPNRMFRIANGAARVGDAAGMCFNAYWPERAAFTSSWLMGTILISTRRLA